MRFPRALLILTGLLALTPSCEKVKSLIDQAKPAAAATAGAGGGGASGEASTAGAGTGGVAGDSAQNAAAGKYALPFVWEASSDEPLARARAYLKEVVSDNATYMARGSKFFTGFAENQTPRATVVTCSDSQVHHRGWHATPENDDFIIRNIGNQIAASEGSIEYGVEHLHTPLLLIVGHSGCDAIKTVLGGLDKESPGVQAELKTLTLPKPEANVAEKLALRNAVLANVHNQVAYAVKKFGDLVQEGKLTVVGTVYDYRNDFSEGAGKLLIVNVNGNSEPKRMKAFTDAINAVQGGDRALGDATDDHSPTAKHSAESLSNTLKSISQLMNRETARN